MYLSNARFVESSDTFGNELLGISVVRQHSLTFDQYYLDTDARVTVAPRFAYRVRPEQADQPLPRWFARPNGHVVSVYPILPGLLNVPALLVATWLGLDLQAELVRLAHITAASVAALSVGCMYASLVQVVQRPATAVFLSVAFAFGTAVWSENSRALSQHGPSVLFLTAALAALLSGRSWLIGAAGLLLGLAVSTRPTDIVIAAALALFVLRRQRPAAWAFFTLAAVPATLLAWYSWVYWGSPLAFGQGQGLDGFTAPEPAAAAVGLLLSPNRGLLVFSPIFVFALVYAGWLLRTRRGPPLLPYLVWSSVALYALYACWSDWAGGHSYGYRYLIETVPTLLLVLGLGWEAVIARRWALRGAFLVALLASIYVHGLGAGAAPCGFDDEPNDIDRHHERLWDVTSGEIARCTRQEVAAIQARVGQS